MKRYCVLFFACVMLHVSSWSLFAEPGREVKKFRALTTVAMVSITLSGMVPLCSVKMNIPDTCKPLVNAAPFVGVAIYNLCYFQMNRMVKEVRQIEATRIPYRTAAQNANTLSVMEVERCLQSLTVGERIGMSTMALAAFYVRKNCDSCLMRIAK